MKITSLNKFDLYDGETTHKDCIPKSDIWFNNSESQKIITSEIIIQDEANIIAINPFIQTKSTVHKKLSDAPHINDGLTSDEFIEFTNMFNLDVKENNNFKEVVYNNHALSLLTHIAHNTKYYIIYSVFGSRAPEGIYVHAIYKQPL